MELRQLALGQEMPGSDVSISGGECKMNMVDFANELMSRKPRPETKQATYMLRCPVCLKTRDVGYTIWGPPSYNDEEPNYPAYCPWCGSYGAILLSEK